MVKRRFCWRCAGQNAFSLEAKCRFVRLHPIGWIDLSEKGSRLNALGRTIQYGGSANAKSLIKSEKAAQNFVSATLGRCGIY